MVRQVLDSYTGDEYVEDYQSPITDIMVGRSPFYKTRELREISEQYWIGPAVPEEGAAAPSGWLLRRRGCPSQMFPVLPDLAQAQAAMDWLVTNDASVKIGLWWLSRGQINPMLNLITKLVGWLNVG